MINYNTFLNENKTELRYSIFDWDDNILIMDTKIYLYHYEDSEWVKKGVSTSEFVKIKDNNWKGWKMEDDAFIDFVDNGPKGNDIFLIDVIESIKKRKFGPSWNNFIETLINGELFAIVTTRGHESDSIKKAVEYIIYSYLDMNQQDTMLRNLLKYKGIFNEDFEYLVDEYLDNCYFIGVMSNYFKLLIGDYTDYSGKIHLAKKKAVSYVIRQFSKYGEMIDADVKIGFSDDDNKYSSAVQYLFINNKELFDNMDFYVFDTSNPSIKGGKKIKI